LNSGCNILHGAGHDLDDGITPSTSSITCNASNLPPLPSSLVCTMRNGSEVVHVCPSHIAWTQPPDRQYVQQLHPLKVISEKEADCYYKH